MGRGFRRARVLVVAGLAAATAVTAPGAVAQAAPGEAPAKAPAAAGTARVAIQVVSNRADLVSGGDALVEVTGVRAADVAKTKVTLGGADVTQQFAVRPGGKYLGLVTGLKDGRNELRVSSPAGGAKLTVTNHPRGGPVFAGPQVQPWDCNLRSATTGLGAPTDAQCNTPTVYRYVYKSTAGGALRPYDPAAPATDVATATTDAGATVPFVVRVETGVIDRGIYSVGVLFDPAKPWAPWAAQAGWNRKVLWTFGGGSAPQHVTAAPGSVLDEAVLGKGFLIATSGLNIHGANVNTIVSAETVTMLKEQIRETYGQIRYTIGSGCSGGSIQQHIIAEQYPGMLDGIQPNCSYPDTWTTATEVQDCGLLVRYWGTPAGAAFTDAQKAAVQGTADPTACVAWNSSFVPTSLPTRAANCGWAEGDPRVYDPATNPGGTRCIIQDYTVNVWGRRPASVWSAPEKAIGRGFARTPADNTGVLYGLGALKAGTITPQQFTDLNVGIGGSDIDGTWQPARRVADAGAPETAYRAGQVTQGYRLDEVPIIDLRGSSNSGDIHTDFHSWEVRARLDKANGNHANQVIWTWDKADSPTSIVAPPAIRLEALQTIDTWLAAVEADKRPLPKAVKVRAHKPGAAVDRCWPAGTPETGVGAAVTDPEYKGACGTAFPYFGDARHVAGEPRTGETLKCALTPLRRQSLPQLTDAQFTALQAAFATGVCDWKRPPVGYRPSLPWLSFEKTGGVPIGPAPRSVPVRS